MSTADAESAAKRVKITDPSSMAAATSVDDLCVNTIRILSAETVQGANSGHPGAPMGCAPMAHLLWSQVMNYSPANPKWINRDRFVLSNGHACALQYTMLHLAGYNLTIDDLKQFRQVGSKTPGHPENHLTEGIEVSTGPLGQGISNAVGLSMAERHLAARFNKPGHNIIDHSTYVICGDGCLQEGVSAEACSLGGHLGLGKLIVLYDDNHITIDGGTDLSFTEDVLKRYEAYGWHTSTVENGDSSDVSALAAAVAAAKAVTDKPSIIKVRTIIGFGSAKQNTAGVHGSPLGPDDLGNVKEKFGFKKDESFVVPADVAAVYAARKAACEAKEAEWNAQFSAYEAAYPADAAELKRVMSGALPAGCFDNLPTYTPASAAKATRQTSQAALEPLVTAIPELLGGSADLTPSNLTQVSGNKVDFQPATPHGRYIRYGVREHGMAAICNGMAAHGGIIPFCATFLNFTGYALGAVRLSALSHFRVLYVMTHDGIGLGEDGPTHQPIEMVASLRAMPNMYVFRPADGNEVSGSYKCALQLEHSPSVLALSRQGCANLEGTSIDKVAMGAYILTDVADPQLCLVATGSEVQLAANAAATLNAEGVRTRVVSFPCWELFEQQSAEYRRSVFANVPTISIEVFSTTGWERYAHAHIGMATYGASGPGPDLYKHFGFTAENIIAKSKKVLAYYAGVALPNLANKVDF